MVNTREKELKKKFLKKVKTFNIDDWTEQEYFDMMIYLIPGYHYDTKYLFNFDSDDILLCKEFKNDYACFKYLCKARTDNPNIIDNIKLSEEDKNKYADSFPEYIDRFEDDHDMANFNCNQIYLIRNYRTNLLEKVMVHKVKNKYTPLIKYFRPYTGKKNITSSNKKNTFVISDYIQELKNEIDILSIEKDKYRNLLIKNNIAYD